MTAFNNYMEVSEYVGRSFKSCKTIFPELLELLNNNVNNDSHFLK